MRLLLINPNTTAAVTQACAGVARAAATTGTEITAVTADTGPRIINSRTENALAAQTVLTLAARHGADADGVLLAVSYDTALMAARELLPIPVVGMTEAGLMAAQMVGQSFGLLVFGTPALYRELVERYGFGGRLAGIRTVAVDAARVGADPASAEAPLAAAAEALAETDGADCVVLCGAAMAGLAERLRDRVSVPLVDGIACAVPMLEMLVRLDLRPPRLGSLVTPTGRTISGTDPALAALLA